MTARRNTLVFGFAFLAVIAFAFSSVFWLQKRQSNNLLSPLRIIFEGSVSGLRAGGNVTFNGIKIGEVRSVKLDNPQRIVALVMIDKDAPIRNDTVVGLKFQGLSGIVAVALKGGAENAPPVDHDGDGTPMLRANVRDVRDIAQSIQATKQNVTLVVDDTRKALGNSIANIEIFREVLAKNSVRWDSIYARGQTLIGPTDKLGGNSNHVIEVWNRIPIEKISNEMSKTIVSFKELASNFDKRAAALNADKQQMQADVKRAAANLDRNPSRLIFGTNGNQVAPARSTAPLTEPADQPNRQPPIR